MSRRVARVPCAKDETVAATDLYKAAALAFRTTALLVRLTHSDSGKMVRVDDAFECGSTVLGGHVPHNFFANASQEEPIRIAAGGIHIDSGADFRDEHGFFHRPVMLYGYDVVDMQIESPDSQQSWTQTVPRIGDVLWSIKADVPISLIMCKNQVTSLHRCLVQWTSMPCASFHEIRFPHGIPIMACVFHSLSLTADHTPSTVQLGFEYLLPEARDRLVHHDFFLRGPAGEKVLFRNGMCFGYKPNVGKEWLLKLSLGSELSAKVAAWPAVKAESS